MNADTVPFWWQDIRRSREAALKGCEQVLDSVRKLLSEPADLNSRTIQSDLEHWTALYHAALRAADSVRNSCSLAESRKADAILSGHTPPEDADLALRGLNVSRDITLLSREMKNRLKLIAEELSNRSRRPRFRGTYRSHYPSQIDVHV